MSFNSEDSSLLGVLPAHSAPPNRGAGDGSALRSLGMGDGFPHLHPPAVPICGELCLSRQHGGKYWARAGGEEGHGTYLPLRARLYQNPMIPTWMTFSCIRFGIINANPTARLLQAGNWLCPPRNMEAPATSDAPLRMEPWPFCRLSEDVATRSLAQEAEKTSGDGGGSAPASAAEVPSFAGPAGLGNEKCRPCQKKRFWSLSFHLLVLLQPEVTGRDKMQFIHQPWRLISKYNSCARQQAFPRREEREERKTQEKRKESERRIRPLEDSFAGWPAGPQRRPGLYLAPETPLPWPVWNKKMVSLGRMALVWR